MRDMNGAPDFFGVPEENIDAARLRKAAGRHRGHVAVPSRQEIATLSPTLLKEVLLNWMELGATEIIPSRGQIALVKEVLVAREDVSELRDAITMCTYFIEGA